MPQKFEVQAQKQADVQLTVESHPMKNQRKPAGIGRALVVGAALGFALFFFSHSALLTSAYTASLLAVLTYRFFRTPRSHKGIEDSAQALLQERAEELAEIRKTINKVQFLENVEKEGERAGLLLVAASERWKRFESVLAARFSPQELTFGRYQSAGEQAYLGILHELSQVAERLKVMSLINKAELERQLIRAQADDPERSALQERLDIRSAKLVEIETIFDAVEEGLTRFDKLSMALADLDTRSGTDVGGLEAQLEQLRELAERAPVYSSKSKN